MTYQSLWGLGEKDHAGAESSHLDDGEHRSGKKREGSKCKPKIVGCRRLRRRRCRVELWEGKQQKENKAG